MTSMEESESVKESEAEEEEEGEEESEREGEGEESESESEGEEESESEDEQEAMSMKKKLEQARRTMEKIRSVRIGDLQDATKLVDLPFPGLRSSCIGERPPFHLKFIGGTDYRRALDATVYNNSWVIITGPKGCGKSCLMRAIAVEYFQRLDDMYKLVCIWRLDTRVDLAEHVRNSLLFTYCNSGAKVIESISSITSLEHLTSFLIERKKMERLFLLTDGEEGLDFRDGSQRERTPEETDRRRNARNWLQALEAQAYKVFKALSPGANDTKKDGRDKFSIHRKEEELFTKDARALFLKEHLLGRILDSHPEWVETAEFLAGAHPMSLFFLNRACVEYVQKIGFVPQRSFSGFHPVDPLTNQEAPVKPAIKNPEELVEDEEDWRAVTARFKQSSCFESVRLYIREYPADQLSDLGDLASLKTGYITRDKSFCTSYLHQVHADAGFERLKRNVFRSRTFVDSVTRMLQDKNVNWAQVGWTLEGFLADAIMSVGLQFYDTLLKPHDMEFVGGQPMELKPEQWTPRAVTYIKPESFSFKYVDGLLVWKDKEGIVHIVAIQVTVSPESHMKTQTKFLQKEHLKRWYCGTCVVHYVFLCVEHLSKRKWGVQADDQQEIGAEVREEQGSKAKPVSKGKQVRGRGVEVRKEQAPVKGKGKEKVQADGDEQVSKRKVSKRKRGVQAITAEVREEQGSETKPVSERKQVETGVEVKELVKGTGNEQELDEQVSKNKRVDKAKPQRRGVEVRIGDAQVSAYSHTLVLSECLRDSLSPKELDLLMKLGGLRLNELDKRKERKKIQAAAYRKRLQELPPSKQALRKKVQGIAQAKRVTARSVIESLAKKNGIDDPSKRQYYSICDLLDAMPDDCKW